jgi:outer membrane protein OmpA-like peptidoglycan-associated protein
MDQMAALGIEASRLTSKGHGQSQPIASNATSEG